MAVIFSTWIYASDYWVVAELFSSQNCEYCPIAQAGLEDLYENQDRVIPLTWYPNAPGSSARKSLYIPGPQTPVLVVSGVNLHSGGLGYPAIINTFYNQEISYNPPMTLSNSIDFDAQGRIVVTTDATLTANITGSESNVKIYTMLTLDNGVPSDPHNDEITRFFVVESHNQNFTQRTSGNTGTYTATFDYNPSWDISDIRAISLVQNLDTADPQNRRIYQATKSAFVGNITAFAVNILSGAPNLAVQFTDISRVESGTITSWAWEFHGDGEINSTAQHPSFLYTTTGLKTVKLTITTASEIFSRTFTNMINVLPPTNISGTIAGAWVMGHSPYIITGNAEVPPGLELNIEEGVEVKVATGTNITIRGKFSAIGTATEPILFTAQDTNWGSLLLQSVSSATLQDTTYFDYVIFEKASDSAIRASNRNVHITNSTFRQNFASSSGAAITLSASGGSFIENTVFMNNWANPDNANGSGAISLLGSGANVTRLRLKRSLLVNNSGRSAGAIRMSNSSLLTIENCTIFNNRNTFNTGGTIMNSGSNLTVINSILNTNRANNDPIYSLGGGTNIVTYSRILGHSGVGNITSDPMFANPTTAFGNLETTVVSDWYLLPGSPCIDAGDPRMCACPGEVPPHLASCVDFRDKEDHLNNPGFPLFPAMGTLRNDMGAFGGGWVPEDVETSTDDATTILPPAQLSIQAYPNPFNPSLNLAINIGDTSKKANVSIYNIKGQFVVELMNDWPTTSQFYLTWDGKDATGKASSTGIYFVRVINCSDYATQKVMLLK
jgi:PKD repeat protein